jgi:hypothetical protein
MGTFYLFAKTRILQLGSRQIDHRTTVCKVGDLEVFSKPFGHAS